jgi:hypothetical protein
MKGSCLRGVLYVLWLFVAIPAYLYATSHPEYRGVVGPFVIVLAVGITLSLLAELRRR